MNKKNYLASIIALAAFSAVAHGGELSPEVSLTLDGRYSDFDEKKLPSYQLPGFMLGGEAGLPTKGFHTGHNELGISAQVDGHFYAKFSAAIVEANNSTEVELEEAWFETLGLDHGISLKGGKFFSALGYLNQQHNHAYDFVDAPLVYQAMLGGKLIDTGAQIRWSLPTGSHLYLELGAELTTCRSFPGGSNVDGNQGHVLFAKSAGAWGESSHWQLGLSHYGAKFDTREGGGHTHGGSGTGAAADIELENGETDITVLDMRYRWKEHDTDRSLTLQAELFQRDEQGVGKITEGANSASADYDGEQQGYYVSAVYQFMPKWRAGARFDQINSDNNAASFVDGGIGLAEYTAETGLGPASHNPKSLAVMLDYSHSAASRLRFQISEVELQQGQREPIFYLQYVLSLGAHSDHHEHAGHTDHE